MNTPKRKSDYSPGEGYTRQDWDEVSDNPELTPEEIASARPFAEVFPELAEKMRRSLARPKADTPKTQITLRIDADIVERFRSTGPGWQTRINDALRAALAAKT